MLRIAAGQHSHKGRKETNQDFHGLYIPKVQRLNSKGIAVALADGISSSSVSQEASQIAVNAFLSDYYCTPESWPVKKAVQRVLQAINSWLFAQTRACRSDPERGYVCTFSAIVFKGCRAHLFHVGDTRVYRLSASAMEQLTEDHRFQNYLSRAMGMDQAVEIDYLSLPLESGDTFVLATDGIYEFVSERFIVDTIHAYSQDLQLAAQLIVDKAFAQGSDDNLTIQILRIETLPDQELGELESEVTSLPLPPALEAGMVFDGYRIVRPLHVGYRSHVHLAMDRESGDQVVIKTPSVEQHGNRACLERFLMEEWIARRIDNPHVVKSYAPGRKRNYLYTAFEYIEGQTLAQWMRDNPEPELRTVREIINQIARGLQVFHRLEMIHQDLRPANLMIDGTGTIKIIDFGSVQVAGLMEMGLSEVPAAILGTEQYSAPEYFLGEVGSAQSDLYSLGVITYQLLTGRLPYGTKVPKCRTRAAQRRLKYLPAASEDKSIPVWVDEAIRKAVHPNPWMRYQEVSEFVHDLHYPNPVYQKKHRPLAERDPVLFWKMVSLVLTVLLLGLAAVIYLKEMPGGSEVPGKAMVYEPDGEGNGSPR